MRPGWQVSATSTFCDLRDSALRLTPPANYMGAWGDLRGHFSWGKLRGYFVGIFVGVFMRLVGFASVRMRGINHGGILMCNIYIGGVGMRVSEYEHIGILLIHGS